MSDDERTSAWDPVIGRSLAYICLQVGDLKEGTLTDRARFLKGLGLSTNDAAAILNTSAASINELFRQARQAKGSRRGKKRGSKKH